MVFEPTSVFYNIMRTIDYFVMVTNSVSVADRVNTFGMKPERFFFTNVSSYITPSTFECANCKNK